MLIGIAGRARSGKYTLAWRLAEKYGFQIYAFANPLKRVLAQLTGWGDEHLYGEWKDAIDPLWGFSPRVAMQKLGTEWGRSLNPEFWLLVAERCMPQSGHVVISDVRFDDEAEFVRERGLLIHLHRADAPQVTDHISEAGVEANAEDVILSNDGTIFDLYRKIDGLVAMIMAQGLYGWRPAS